MLRILAACASTVPVRERTRRAVRAEPALLAQELFTAQGYDTCDRE
jgi:hypothetical protein